MQSEAKEKGSAQKKSFLAAGDTDDESSHNSQRPKRFKHADTGHDENAFSDADGQDNNNNNKNNNNNNNYNNNNNNNNSDYDEYEYEEEVEKSSNAISSMFSSLSSSPASNFEVAGSGTRPKQLLTKHARDGKSLFRSWLDSSMFSRPLILVMEFRFARKWLKYDYIMIHKTIQK